MVAELSRGLQQLHELLKKLGESERTLAMGPKRIAAVQKAVQAAKDAIEAAKLEIRNSKKHADELNLKLRSKEGDLLKLQGMLNQASSNKEYDLMKGQIQSARNERETMEDSALAAMEKADSLTAALKEREAELKLREQQLKDVEAEVRSAEDGLKASITELQAQVTQAESVITSGDVLTTYRRLRGAHHDGALAAAEDGFCSACNSKITTQDLVRMNTGTALLCRECGRLLYIV